MYENLITEEDLQALNIIKRHVRHFKKPVDTLERISFCVYKTNTEEFEFLLSWIKAVEKERGWKL